MLQKNQPGNPSEVPSPKQPEIKPLIDPDEPFNVSEEDPDMIPGEKSFEEPP